jgi:quercetin dioxygenase-like cupin family protein
MPGQTHDPVHGASYAFQPDGENLIVETWLEPGGALPPHFHPHQEEHWSVVEGEVRFQLGNEKRLLRPADGEVLVSPGTKHGLKSSSDREAHLRCRVVPARQLQSFLEDSAAAARDGLFMRGGIPKSVRGARWAARFLKQHQEDVVVTFPPRFVQSALIALFGR